MCNVTASYEYIQEAVFVLQEMFLHLVIQRQQFLGDNAV
jgi:hypothetical protein